MPSSRPSSLLALFLLLCLSPGCALSDTWVSPDVPRGAGDSPVLFSLFLIGDAGLAESADDPVLSALTDEASDHPDRSFVVFLGDNIYPDGVPPTDASRARRRLRAQVEAVKRAGCRSAFVPGNHDWGYGLAGLKRQERLIAEWDGPSQQLLPKAGDPGPTALDLGESVRLILFDNEWWFHDPSPEKKKQVAAAITNAIAMAGSRRVVVCGHRPLRSHGPMGGCFTWKEHIFPFTEGVSWLWLPLPILGSAYPLVRLAGITEHDLANGTNRAICRAIEKAFQAADRLPDVHAAGHEHNLQILKGDGTTADYLIVSGSGSEDRATRVGRGEDTLFAAPHPGFCRLDFCADGSMRATMIVLKSDGLHRTRLQLSP